MGFYDYIAQYKDFDFEGFLSKVTKEDVQRILSKNKIEQYEFLALLSPSASLMIESMAQRAHNLALSHFGKSILLYTPMYIANHCVNRCAYCSFNVENDIKRSKLNLEQIEQEAKEIAKSGLKHILVLTGESKKETPVSYIVDAVTVLKKYFDSIAIEIYPLTTEEYSQVIEAGVDGLTIYQEVYDEEVYKRVHIAGPKKNYNFRLDAPERACQAKMRSVNIGALLGLADWRKEAFTTGLHGNYLQDKYPEVEMNLSPPRIRPHLGAFEDVLEVGDKELVQIILAFKIFLPHIGITLSTRENEKLRDNLIPLGITKMSAGVSTEVGGHSASDKGESQFEISDKRSVEEIKQAILQRGYQPIFKNWMQI